MKKNQALINYLKKAFEGAMDVISTQRDYEALDYLIAHPELSLKLSGIMKQKRLATIRVEVWADIPRNLSEVLGEKVDLT